MTVTVTVRGGVGIGRGASGRTTVLPNACCTKSFGDSSAGRNLASVWEYPILGVSCSGSPGASSVSMGWFGIGDLGQTGAMGWGIDHSGKHGKGLGGGVGQGVGGCTCDFSDTNGHLGCRLRQNEHFPHQAGQENLGNWLSWQKSWFWLIKPSLDWIWRWLWQNRSSLRFSWQSNGCVRRRFIWAFRLDLYSAYLRGVWIANQCWMLQDDV